MADHRRELKSQYDALRRLYDDLHGTTFARRDWHAEVVARRTLGSDDRIEHGFLAEHFLIAWSDWRGLFDRYCRYFGQPAESFPGTWSRLIAQCDVLVFRLAREPALDEIIAHSWIDPDDGSFKPVSRRRYDIATIYSQVARRTSGRSSWSGARRSSRRWPARRPRSRRRPRAVAPLP